MTYAALARHDVSSPGLYNLSPPRIGPAISCAVALALSALFVQWMSSARLPPEPPVEAAPARDKSRGLVQERAAAPGVAAQVRIEPSRAAPQSPAPPRIARQPASAPAVDAALSQYAALFDPPLSHGRAPAPFAHDAPLASIFVPLDRHTPATVSPVAAADHESVAAKAVATTIADIRPVPPGSLPPGSSPPRLVPPRIVPSLPVAAERVASIPIPPPRPADLSPPRSAETVLPRSADLSPRERSIGLPGRRRSARQTATASLAPQQVDHRSFFERLFDMPQPSGNVTAYAAPETSGLSRVAMTPMRTASYDRSTAIYDIAAHTVYLPDGTRLEAHSGLGAALDDPGGVSRRMRGATPPNVYELQPREQLFHGVRALRLNPVGNGTTYGRDGLLAHTYMLGPRGDSNGCVAFRDYNAFLRAYETGGVRRLAVVSSLN